MRRIAYDLSMHACTFEQIGPLHASFWRAGNNHLVLIAEQAPQSIKHVRIMKFRINPGGTS
jgi:hypothetical protein